MNAHASDNISSTVEIVSCHFYNNDILGSTGVVFLSSSATNATDSSFLDANILNSTFSNNTIGDPSDPGGVIFGGCVTTDTWSDMSMGVTNYSSLFLEINNTIFSGNTVGSPGVTRRFPGSAGIFMIDEGSRSFDHIVKFYNSTFTENQKIGPASWTQYDSSIFIGSSILSSNGMAEFILKNAMIANNRLADASNSTKVDLGENFFNVVDSGYNFIGYSTVPLTEPTSQSGTLSHPLNPKVLPLGNYGGLTPTHGLLPCSPLIDTGDPNAPATDQRDSMRVGIPDIGAFEYQGSPAGMGPFTVDGTVTQSTGAPLSNAKIYLVGFQASDSSVVALDSTVSDGNGNYSMTANFIDFYLKAAPDSSVYPSEMPTYEDSSLTFQGARLICGSETVDFSTIAGGNPGGPGFIGGLLSKGAGKKADPLGGITLLLWNPINGKALDVTLSNDDGYFSFADIPLGDYEVWVDKPLIDNAIAPMVSLTAQMQNRDSLTFFLHSTYLELRETVGVEDRFEEVAHQVFPNPAEEELFIRVENERENSFRFVLIDLMGREIFTKNVTENTTKVDVSSLSKGVYFYFLEGNKNQKSQGRLVIGK